MEMSSDLRTDLVVESRDGLYVARFLPGVVGAGNIVAPNMDESERRDYAEAVMDSIVPVVEAEVPYSDCTDGRFRTTLNDGQPVPNREKLVGADLMIAFSMSEALGSRFYKDPAAPIDERLREVAGYLLANGILPSTHGLCGARGGFVSISQNSLEFNDDPMYVARQKMLTPAEIQDDEIFGDVLRGTSSRLSAGRYKDYDESLAAKIAEEFGGSHAIANLRDDGRGVGGHVEGGIVRLLTPGYSVDVNRLASANSGMQVFAVNDNRLRKLSELFGRGHDTDYRIAYAAGEIFTDAGHATLGKEMTTMIVEPAA